jgi:hypothetical protein
MDQTKSGFLKALPTKEVIFTKPYGEIIIPQSYIEHHIAEIIGQEIEIFGLFDILVWDTFEIEKYKPTVYHFKFPSKIRTSPSEIENKKFPGESENSIILKYTDGDVFIVSTAVQKDPNVARQMIDIIFNGYMPSTISYSDIYDFWTKVNDFNGVKINASEAVLELVISELCRDPNDLSQEFRKAIQKQYKSNPGSKIDLKSRKMVNIRDIPKYSSTFASLTSGNPSQGITSSIARRRTGKPDKETPVETAIE